MILGQVGQLLEPRIPLTLLDSTGGPLHISATIDTGFYGFLVLPPVLVQHLCLESLAEYPVELADSSVISPFHFQAKILWRDAERIIRVIEMESEPLVGVNLLWGHHLAIDLIVGGTVTLTPLP